MGSRGISVWACANGARLIRASRMGFFICFWGVRLFEMGRILTDFGRWGSLKMGVDEVFRLPLGWRE